MMNLMGNRGGFCEDEEEEEDQGSKGMRRPFSHSHQPSPSSSSSSSSLRRQKGLVPHHHQMMISTRTVESSSSPTNTGGEDIYNNIIVVDDSAEVVTGRVVEREHMFDKVVTPSDVGKLNRLVIPKQHAEKYFPLDSSANEKGLLLNFEDRNGKPWRFRYSYWNSSQSYVMTKGWSRFVKEKKLDAGDIVSFQRGIGEFAKDRLFIDWRRRPHHELPRAPPPPIPAAAFSLPAPNHLISNFHPWNHHHRPSLFSPPPREHLHLLHPAAATAHFDRFGNSNNNLYGSGSVIYLKSAGIGGGVLPQQQQQQHYHHHHHEQQQQVGTVQLQRGLGVSIGGGGVESMAMPNMPMAMPMPPVVFESVPVVQGKAAAKRMRLFGVNMECPISESDECDILSSTTIAASSSIPPPLPLRPYEMFNKDKASSMSLDLDI